MLADSVRHTTGRPDAVWAEANAFFGHDKVRNVFLFNLRGHMSAYM